SVAVLLRSQEALKGWVLHHSLEVSAASARIAQAEADLGASSVFLPNPVVDFTLSDINVGASNPPGLRFNETSIYSVGLSQTVELGKRGLRMDAARLRVASSGKEYR